MNFKQKAGYMFIGCLFTIAGYILATIGGRFTHAQQNEQAIDKIICKSLEVVNTEGTTIATIQENITKGAMMDFRDRNGKRIAKIEAFQSIGYLHTYKDGNIVVGIGEDPDSNIYVVNKEGKKLVGIGANEQGGSIFVGNKDNKVVASIGATKLGALIDIFNKDGDNAASIGATKLGAAIELYNVITIMKGEHGGVIHINDKKGGLAVYIASDEHGKGIIDSLNH